MPPPHSTLLYAVLANVSDDFRQPLPLSSEIHIKEEPDLLPKDELKPGFSEATIGRLYPKTITLLLAAMLHRIRGGYWGWPHNPHVYKHTPGSRRGNPEKQMAMVELEMMKTERSLAEVGSSTSPKVNISEGDSQRPQEPLGVTFWQKGQRRNPCFIVRKIHQGCKSDASCLQGDIINTLSNWWLKQNDTGGLNIPQANAWWSPTH